MNEYNKDYYKQRYENEVGGISPDVRRAYLYKARLRMLKRLSINGCNVLEIGCGSGPMTKHLIESYQSVTAIDISNEAIKLCKSSIKNNNLHLQVAMAENLPLEDSSIDIIFAYDVYEHVENLNLALKEAYRVLRDDGILYISVPNPNSLGARIKGKYPEYKGLPLAKRKKQWFGWQDDTHINILPIHVWRNKIEDHKFEIVKDGTDYWWDSPYVSWLPTFPQDLICKVLQRIFTRISYFANWHLGENYIGIYKKNTKL